MHEGDIADPLSEIAALSKEQPYCDIRKIRGNVRLKHVFWLDLMGARNAMSMSLARAANFVVKIHDAALQANDSLGVDLVPVVDGLYGLSDNPKALLHVLASSLRLLSLTFLLETDHYLRFLVRAAIAHGPVVHVTGLHGASRRLEGHPEYTQSVAVGIAITQAYDAEKLAPPFGVYVHESARAAVGRGSNPYRGVFYDWAANVPNGPAIREAMGKGLAQYYDWVRRNHRMIQYPADRIEAHWEVAREYFEIWPDTPEGQKPSFG